MPEKAKTYIAKRNRVRNLVISIIATFCALFFLFLPMFGVSGGIYAAAETDSALMRELDGLKIDGKPFTAEDYPADKNGAPQMLNLYEVGYSCHANKCGAYALWVYVYNPAQLSVPDDSRNSVQMRIGTAARYDKYKLKLIETSADKLYYKFKVDFTDDEKLLALYDLQKDKRTYDVSSIELYSSGYNATDYPISRLYTFTGYAAGLGEKADDDSTLASTLNYTVVGGTETIPLKVQHTSWRPKGTNGKSEYTQDVLHSVYFAIPNEYAKKYDYLDSVKAEWLTAKTAPVLVTDNKDVIQAIQQLQEKQKQEADLYGTDLSEKFDFANFDWLLSSKQIRSGNVIEGIKETIEVFFGSDYWYRQFSGEYYESGHTVKQEIVKRINALYLTANGTGVLTSSEIENTIKEAAANYKSFNDKKVANKYPGFLFESYDKQKHTEIIKVGDKRTLNSEEVKRSWWERLLNMSHVENKIPYKNIDSIQEVTDSLIYGGSEEEICNRLYISERDYKAFTAFYDTAQKEDSTVYLLRFATSEYWSAEIDVSQEGFFGMAVNKGNGYFAQSNCYLDFDIIDLEYKKNDESFIIPVTMSPIDVFTEFTPPIKNKTGLPWWVWLVIGALALILLAPLLTVLYVILKVIFTVLKLPFKIVGKITGGQDDGKSR